MSVLLASRLALAAVVAGEKRVSVIFIQWQGDVRAIDVVRDAQVVQEQLNRVWREGSYGRTWMVVTGYGPYVIPRPAAALNPCVGVRDQVLARYPNEPWVGFPQSGTTHYFGFIVPGCGHAGGGGWVDRWVNRVGSP